MNDKVLEVLVEKTIQLLEAIEDFESNYVRPIPRVKGLAQEVLDLLNKAEFMNKH